jgi:hypothetical protein
MLRPFESLQRIPPFVLRYRSTNGGFPQAPSFAPFDKLRTGFESLRANGPVITLARGTTHALNHGWTMSGPTMWISDGP